MVVRTFSYYYEFAVCARSDLTRLEATPITPSHLRVR